MTSTSTQVIIRIFGHVWYYHPRLSDHIYTHTNIISCLLMSKYQSKRNLCGVAVYTESDCQRAIKTSQAAVY